MMESGKNIDLNKYVTWINEGKSFSHVREDLKTTGISDDEIKNLIVQIDNMLIDQAMNADQGFSAKKSDTIGKVLVAIGGAVLVIFIFIHSYTILGIGGALFSAGVTFILFGRKLVKGTDLCLRSRIRGN
ncbi:MAG: hypothetical protein WDN75_08310 [Bacteroidota bacterium]